jgi:uncharacterized membrane protein YedE/YeeE
MNLVGAFLSGVLFALGLTLSGMTQPARVLGFLDVAGQWDPTLMFVMGGALAVYAPLFRLILRRKYPLAAASFELPSERHIGPKLLVGSGMFGVGWGLAGMCPGPAIVTLGTLLPQAFVFVAAMVAGALLFRLYDDLAQKRRVQPAQAQQAPDA